MTEAEYERTVDRRVMARLRTDLAYRNAAGATEQADREAEIEEEELHRLNCELLARGEGVDQ
jgi:hypothetical protein